MNIGEALRELRESLGLTQKEVSDAVGIKRTTYISYESSKSIPKYDIMEKLARFFGISVKYFSDEPQNKTEVKISAPTIKYEFPTNKELSELSNDERLVLKYLRLLDDKERDTFIKEIKNEYLETISEKINNGF